MADSWLHWAKLPFLAISCRAWSKVGHLPMKTIEDDYGHITSVKNGDRILLWLPGWESGQPDGAPVG
jgi:hypothetical protein